jgi:hypothetical protein
VVVGASAGAAGGASGASTAGAAAGSAAGASTGASTAGGASVGSNVPCAAGAAGSIWSAGTCNDLSCVASERTCGPSAAWAGEAQPASAALTAAIVTTAPKPRTTADGR